MEERGVRLRPNTLRRCGLPLVPNMINQQYRGRANRNIRPPPWGLLFHELSHHPAQTTDKKIYR